ncbi:lysosomal Pro-X carboxypeptidase-like [Diorhabda carinulata]|uniref:lysosomal Pro-X carboxypeptidase-like n=1 Tax=Diorhabda sublineata TaxID=1163346 RepID=UPI0024E08174|nr:lysosomal Pro-X carboxypeptidase-like [Diorhabda sublineata]XP_057671720.1 lysosomal Pro-X carboxypeptidase-like [Diorhabda carinulata]
MYLIKFLLLFAFVTCGICESKYSLETKYIEVPLDHFSATQTKTFRLRYLISSKYHVKGGPVFVYTGNEGNIDTFAQNTGFLFDIAPTFNALLVFIEHRYYGESLPFGNSSFSTPETLRYLTTTQALADYAFVIEDLRKTFFGTVITSETYPFIAFGGSYGGMLAAWLRMKYPYTVLGAVASSAPIWYFPNLTPCEKFYEKVTKVFEKYGKEQCVKSIRLGWEVITNLSKTKLGMDFISSSWRLCKKLRTPLDVERLLDWLTNVYVKLAMVNYHYPTEFEKTLPAYPVKVFCDKLTTSFFNDTKSLIEHFSHALEIYTNYTGTTKCNNINSTFEDFKEYAWDYQSCTELVRPICSTEKDMFITKPWSYERFSTDCLKKFNVKSQRPNWAIMAYGGTNLKYFSNIIFSNGLLDPWSCGGVLNNISDSIVAVNITDAPHHVDLRNSDPADNNYVIEARKFHIATIKRWLNV